MSLVLAMALGKLGWKNLDKFKDGPPTFSLRHPDLKGPFLRKQFDADYVEFICHNNVPLFHKGGPRRGQPVFKRHHDNKRKNRAQSSKHMQNTFLIMGG